MRKFILYILSASLLSWPVFGTNGNDQGHGAIGVVCYDFSLRNVIKASYLFDLWEGEQPTPFGRGLRILRSNEPMDSQIGRALLKLSFGNNEFAKQVQLALSQVRRDFFIMRDIGETNDVDPILDLSTLPNECYTRQLGVYEDDDINNKVLKIERDVYDTLISPTDQAAFFLHEAIFKVLRQNYALYEYWDRQKQKRTNLGESSRVARHIVAALFSDQNIESTDPHEYAGVACQGNYFQFLISGNLNVEVLQLGVPVFSKTQAQLHGDSVLVGEIRSELQFLESGSHLRIQPTNNPYQYDVSAVGGKFEIPKEKVNCSAPISSFSKGQ